MAQRSQRRLSLLEFTLALPIIAVLTLTAFDRIAAVRSQMEHARVRQTVAAMRSALALRFAELAVEGKLRMVGRYNGANALALLSPPPAGYRGERESATAAGIAPGNWYYATATGVVVYRPRDPGAFERSNSGAGRLYWRALAGRDSGRGPQYDRYESGGIALVRARADGVPLPNNHEP